MGDPVGWRAGGQAHEPMADPHPAPHLGIHLPPVRPWGDPRVPNCARAVVMGSDVMAYSVSAEPAIRPGPLLEQDHPSPTLALL